MDKQAFELWVLRLIAEDADRRSGNVAWVGDFDTLGDVHAWACQAGLASSAEAAWQRIERELVALGAPRDLIRPHTRFEELTGE